MKTTRRNLLRATGAAAGAGATGLGLTKFPRYSPVGRASAIAPIAVGGAVVAGGVLGYLAGEAVDYFTGPDGGTLSATEEASFIHSEVYSEFAERANTRELVLTTMDNRLQDTQNISWVKAKREAIKALNAGETEATATTNAQTVSQEYYAQIQKNLINHWNQMVSPIPEYSTLVTNTTNLAIGDVFYNGDVDGSTNFKIDPSGNDITVTSKTLVDGTTVSNVNQIFFAVPADDGGQDNMTFNIDSYPSSNIHSSGLLKVLPPDTQPQLDLYPPGNSTMYSNNLYTPKIWNEIVNQSNTMDANIDQSVTDLYANVAAGDIDPTQYLDPVTLASEFSSDYDTTGRYAYAAAEAAVLGLKTDLKKAMTIELVDSQITVTGLIWTNWDPEGTGSLVTKRQYDPSATNEEVYISFEYTGDAYIEGADVFVKGSDTYERTTVNNSTEYDSISSETIQVYFGTVSEPFIIQEATDVETGETVDTVTMESKNYQTADTAVTTEELEQLLDLQAEMLASELEDDSPAPSGGGFDWSSLSAFGIPGEFILGAAGVGAYLVGSNKL